MLNWFSDVPFDELYALGVRFVCIGSITSSPDSAQSFLNWAGELRDQVSLSGLQEPQRPMQSNGQ